MPKNKNIKASYYKVTCKISEKFTKKWQSYGTLKFDQITPLCHFFRINNEYFLKFKYFNIRQRRNFLTYL